ncbi:MAG: protein kinase [Planctomycetaceae bacterium]
MTNNEATSNDGLEDIRQRMSMYRCVCGQSVSFQYGPVTCPACGRVYNEDVLRAATVETAFLAFDAGHAEDGPSLPAGATKDEFLGRRMGHFRILSRIGSGGMGTVYRALDESLQRYVALKVLREASVGANDARLQSLFQEARAQARVNHPHVAHIYYVGSASEVPYLAMELVGQRSLSDRLKEGPLPYQLIVRFAQQITKALRAAARFDIVHGDVKPANILMVDQHTVKLSDFGLASRLSAKPEESDTAVGTLDYLPPECTLGFGSDHRGDMYSLGVALFEMTFGRLPYTPSSHDVHERLRLHREAEVEFPESWPSDLPQGWRRVLSRLLEKDPQQRYDDFSELLADLDRLEPTVLPNASLMLRSFAWLSDVFVVAAPLAIIATIAVNSGGPLVAILKAIMGGAVVSAMCLLQVWWGTTPGKRLFQIRIVDQHGLRPSQTVLSARAGLQFIWAWTLVLDFGLRLASLADVGQIVNLSVILFLLVEMACVVAGKRRSVHDRICGTRVVLDTSVLRRMP